MKYWFYLLIPFLLTSCFTGQLLDKAKKEKKYETIQNVQHSNIDSAGNVFFIIKRFNSKKNYAFKINIDTLFMIYKDSKQLNLIFDNAERKNNGYVAGIFYNDDLPKNYPNPLLIFLERKSLKSITADERPANMRNFLEAELYAQRHFMPVETSGSSSKSFAWNNQKYMTVVYKDYQRTSVRPNPSNRTFIIGIQSIRKRNLRYLLTPLTVVADVATFPIQLIVYGFIQLIKF